MSDPFEAARHLQPSPSSSNAPSFSFSRRVATVDIAVSVRDVQISADEDQLPANTLGSRPMAPSQLLCDESTDATDVRRGQKRNNKGKKQGPNDPGKTLTFSQVPFKPGDAVTCIILQSGSGNKPTETVVPLWPQVTAHWSKRDIQSQRWLRVRSDQQWLEMVCLHAKLPNKDRKRFSDCIQKQMVRHLVKKREFTEHDSDDEDSQNNTSAIGNTIQIEIGGCCATFLNNGVQLAFQVDTNAMRFISEYLCSEALKFRSEQKVPESQTSPTSSGTGNEQVAPVQGWMPNQNWTPSIRDKVQWNVGDSRFDVFVQEKKGKEAKDTPRIIHFGVPCNPDAKAYHEYKKKQYEDAVTTWNQLDKGTRDRIVPILVT